MARAQAANLPQSISGGGYRIAGTIVSKIDSHALARARITITDAKDAKRFESLITADDGKFEFTGLPAGKYSLTGAKRGFIPAAYDQHDQYSSAIVTGASLDTEHLTLRLAPNAVIAGKVLDEAGEPVRRAMVTLYYDDHSSGVEQIRQSRGSQTDDQGSYEFTPLHPGTYFISASAKPWYAIHPPSARKNSEQAQSTSADGVDQSSEDRSVNDRALDVAYATTFYADVTDTDSATPIPVRGGDRLQVDLHFTPVPALRLLFNVPGDGRRGFPDPQIRQPAFDGTTLVQNSGVRMVSPGLIEVTGVPAGRYDVRLGAPERSVQMNGVDLSKDGQEIDTLAAEPMCGVKVSVKVAGEPAFPPRLFLGLRSRSKVLTGLQSVDTKGEVEFEQVTAGSYEIVVRGSSARYSIAHMTAEGAQVSGHSLTLVPGSSASVSVTLVGGKVEVAGTVKKAGHPSAGAMVVLVPKNAEADCDLFRRDQSDLDGTFSLRGIVPGSYTLLAIENGWDLDWSQSSVISGYLKGGRKIQVGNQSGGTVNVAEAIEVQSE